MWNPWKKTPAPKEYTITPKVTLQDVQSPVMIPIAVPEPPKLIIAPQSVLLKRLKWVDYKGRVAIVVELDSSGFAKIDYVARDGTTEDQERVRAGDLKLAGYTQIPEPRRINLSRAYAATLGYV